MDSTIHEIRNYINDGFTIKWVGYHSNRKVHVHMARKDQIIKLVLKLEYDYSDSSFKEIRSMSSYRPRLVTGTIWSSDSRLELLRLASILGINVGGSAQPGHGQEFNSPLGCIMSYDIESDRSRIPKSSFGTLSESIVSIAVYCSCGLNRIFSFIKGVDFDYELCDNSMDTVSKFIKFVENHSPQWLVGYNNFGYDNTRIAYHSDDHLDSILIPMRVGSGSSLTYAFYIDIEGTYNVDLMVYLDKTRRSMYPNMALSTLVRHHGIADKMEFDTSDIRDLKRLFEYNIHDCKITTELAIKTNVMMEISYLCLAACVPVIDSARFVSGTFASCSLASYCLSNSISMDWSPCLEYHEYRGAEVLKPKIGLHEDVVSCDFSSMYPTILLSSNISIENYIVGRSTMKDGGIWYDDTLTTFAIGTNMVSFDRHSESVVPQAIRYFVGKRREVRKSKPTYASALKIIGNSMYGSLGDRNSNIYSPMCSAAITTGGRWCLALAESIIHVFGYTVVYGDTDSCYVKKTHKSICPIETVVKIMRNIFMFTPFPGMSMEIEGRFSRIVFLGKKTYFGMTDTGSVISKGMSKSRKDRLGICRSLSSNVVHVILSEESKYNMKVKVADMISYAIDRCVFHTLPLSYVSKYVKRGGSNYFEYVSSDGQRQTLECESYTGDEVVDYSVDHVSKMISRELSLILAVSGTGSIGDIMRYASII